MNPSTTQLHDAPAYAVMVQDAVIDLTDLVISSARSVAAAKLDPASPAAVMKRNLTALFCEPDPTTRGNTFDELWHSNAVIYHGEDARAGRAAVLDIAGRFHQRMEGLTCFPASPVSGSNDLYMLRWVAQRAGEPVATGCCIGFLVRGRIHSFYMIED